MQRFRTHLTVVVVVVFVVVVVVVLVVVVKEERNKLKGQLQRLIAWFYRQFIYLSF